MNKKEFRKKMMTYRESFPDEYIRNSSEKVFNLFMESSLYKNSENIFIFVSYNKEIDTHNIIKKALSDGKNIFIPLVDRKKRIMNISKLDNFDSLSKGYMGILEPKEEDINIYDKEVLDLVVVPGLAFDKYGYRMGYGGGFYDKFLSSMKKQIIKLGIGYNLQLVEKVVCDEFDQPLDYFISEEGLIRLGRSN